MPETPEKTMTMSMNSRKQVCSAHAAAIGAAAPNLGLILGLLLRTGTPAPEAMFV